MARRIRQNPSHRGQATVKMDRDMLRRALTVDLTELDFATRLKVNGDEMMRRVGQRVATKVRSGIKKQTNWDGSRFPGGVTLQRSKTLLRSIKYRRGIVAPDWWILRTDVSRRARTSYGLMAIHVAMIPGLDPFGWRQPDARAAELTDLAAVELGRQIDRGEAGLIFELRRNLRRGRRPR